MITITLRSREAYWSAGRKYGFSGAGISLNAQLVDKCCLHNQQLRVVFREKNYYLNPHEVARFSKRHGSVEERNGVMLYVYSLRKMEDANEP